jgi:hypothetical protein
MKMTLIITMYLLLAACTDSSQLAYPDRYADALQEHVGARPPADGAERFAALFAALHTDAWDEAARDLYAESLYFNDTLFTTDNRPALIEHFGRVRDTSAVKVVIDDAFVSNTDVYLRWRMSARIQLPLQQADTHPIGMTLLRFNDAGEIIFHQDFWDSTEGFYRHLPLLGSAIDQVRTRFAESI